MNRCYKILSIDGGGIKGLYSAIILSHIEKQFNIKLVDYFDMICGTSTGGLIALGLASGFTATEMVDFYTDLGPKIFPRKWYYPHWIRKTRNVFWRSKYSNKQLKKAVNNLFGNRTMSDSQCLLMIPSFRLTGAEPRVFKYPHKEGNFYKDENIKMSDVALATSAAPTFFSIHKINNDLHIDGGIWANNPSLTGLIEALDYFVGENKQFQTFSILSIPSLMKKNASCTDDNKIKGRKNRGILGWNSKLIETIMDSQSFSIDFMTRKIAKYLDGTYFRLPLAEISSDQEEFISLDRADKKAINTITLLAEDMATKLISQTESREQLKQFFKEKKSYIIEVKNVS